MKTIEELRVAYLDTRKAANLASKEFESALVAAYPCAVGDIIETDTYRKTVICQVTKLWMKECWSNDGFFYVTGIAYPIKKDGTMAKVGEIRLTENQKIRMVNKAEAA